MEKVDAYSKVLKARANNRPNVHDYINYLFDDFIELHGDRYYRDDPSMVGGIALFQGMPVTVVGTLKGKTVEENIACNFGMASPEGYRKAIRLMKQADKFGRPIITFVDTPGAYPGLDAEKNGQGEAIARSIMEMSTLSVPVITFIIGEGGSGGALALAVSNKVIMLENSIYSILSPEGFATILYKDSTKAKEVSEIMKLTAKDLLDLKVIDGIIEEPDDIENQKEILFMNIKQYLVNTLKEYEKKSRDAIYKERYNRFRKF